MSDSKDISSDTTSADDHKTTLLPEDVNGLSS